MKPHLVAAVAAVAALAATWGLSTAISDKRPVYSGQAKVVGDAIAAIAPSAAGGECQDTSSMMPINTVRIADQLMRTARRSPNVVVPAPSGQGEMRLADIPGTLAEELSRCIATKGAPGPGWERMVARLKTR